MTLDFRVIHQGDAYGVRWNEFSDPFNIGNIKIFQKACLEIDIGPTPNYDIGHDF